MQTNKKRYNSYRQLVAFIVIAIGFIVWQIFGGLQTPVATSANGSVNELIRLLNSVTKAAYEGDWHEIARTPNMEQFKCVDGTGHLNIYYDVQSNISGGGSRHFSTSVTNECQMNANGKKGPGGFHLPSGKKIYTRKTYGIFDTKFLYDFIYSKRVEENRPGGPHPYDYTVLASGNYVWFLAREPYVPDSVFEEMKAAAQNDGANISDLVVSPRQINR
jgi:lipocalin